MTDETTDAFRAGYEAGKHDAIDRCLIERVGKDHPDWRSHNVAVSHCVLAIRALDVRHAIYRADVERQMKFSPLQDETTASHEPEGVA